MKFDTYKPGVAVQTRSAKPAPYPSCPLNWTRQLAYSASTWVHLLELPNPFSYDEAMLLCKHSDEEWLAWIPDHGEAVLHTSQFCFAG